MPAFKQYNIALNERMSHIRAFIGIDFDKELKKEIYELQQRIKKYASKGRWKHIDNFHLTLKFLDDISSSQRIEIDKEMELLCSKYMPFKLEMSEIGVFNGRETVRVLWLGLTGDIEALRSMHKEIDKIIAPIGFPAEKRSFKPHITIGQDIIFDCDFEQIKTEIGKIQFDNIKVDSLNLFKSEQLQHKRIYTKVSEYGMSEIL